MATTKVNKPSGLEAIIGKKAYDKMGNYKEATGGGTPIPKGEKLKDHPEAKRVKQPRDDDGRFTYNAVNFKELKTKDSRGITVPPFLRGVKINFAKKGDKNYIWQNGKRYEIDLNGLDKNSFIRTFQVYGGKLNDGTLVFTGNGDDYKLKPEVEAKRGAYSKSEKVSKGWIDSQSPAPKKGVHTNYDPLDTMNMQDLNYYFGGGSKYYGKKGSRNKVTNTNPNPNTNTNTNTNTNPNTNTNVNTNPTQSSKFDFSKAYKERDAKNTFFNLPKDVQKELFKRNPGKGQLGSAMGTLMRQAVKSKKISEFDDFVDFVKINLGLNK